MLIHLVLYLRWMWWWLLPDAALRWFYASPGRRPLTSSEGWDVSGVRPLGCVLSPRACEGQTGAESHWLWCLQPRNTPPVHPRLTRAAGSMRTDRRWQTEGTLDRDRCIFCWQPASLRCWRDFSGFSPAALNDRRQWTRLWMKWPNSFVDAEVCVVSRADERLGRRVKNGKMEDSFYCQTVGHSWKSTGREKEITVLTLFTRNPLKLDIRWYHNYTTFHWRSMTDVHMNLWSIDEFHASVNWFIPENIFVEVDVFLNDI